MTRYQQDQNYIKEHANYETGVCNESQFNFYNWIIRIIKLYNRINLKKNKSKNMNDVAIILETKSEERDISKQIFIDELMKNIDIISSKYIKIVF